MYRVIIIGPGRARGAHPPLALPRGGRAATGGRALAPGDFKACYSMLYFTRLDYTTLHYTTLHYTIPYHTIPYHTHTILHCLLRRLLGFGAWGRRPCGPAAESVEAGVPRRGGQALLPLLLLLLLLL